jgi:hypothetical protein
MTRAQSLHIRRLELAEALAPGIQRLVAHFVFLGDLRDRCAVGFAKLGNHFFFGESALLHGLPL